MGKSDRLSKKYIGAGFLFVLLGVVFLILVFLSIAADESFVICLIGAVVCFAVSLVYFYDPPSDGTENESSSFMTSVSQEYYEDVKRVSQDIMDFVDSLMKNKGFCEHVTDRVKVNMVIYGEQISDPAGIVKYMSLVDVVRCYRGLGHEIDLDDKDSLGLFLYTLYVLDVDTKSMTLDSADIYLKNMKLSVLDYLRQFDTQREASGNSDAFFILECLLDFDEELAKRYSVLLYRFASIVAKADNTVTEKEAAWLEQIVSSGDIKDGSTGKLAIGGDPQRGSLPEDVKGKGDVDANDPYVALESLIGLESVKQEITTLANYVRIQQLRHSQGLKTSPVSYHCVFTGNPGTGKTTVARIVAGIYKDLGILKRGHLVETDRSGLVAEYVGQTAVKTNKIIDSALDGVLFIDEAYSLVPDDGKDYGKEAIATLLKRMEDDRDRLVVILAGYSDEMKNFIDSNPGLQSRFNRYVEFPDYSVDELYRIFCSRAKEYEYILSDDASDLLRAVIEKAVANKDKKFGNGRFVRNLFEKTIEHQANRLSRASGISAEILMEIEAEDIFL